MACLLGIAAGIAQGASEPKRASFNVTLKATVTKDWNTVGQTTEEGCPVTKHWVGRRTVKLRSTRPTTAVVTFAGGRASYSPSAVRFVAVEVGQTGSQSTSFQAPCPVRTTKVRCRRAHRTVGGGTFRFFRSARNEVSFRNAPLPAAQSSCPRESSKVRSIRPGLHEAQGELSEATLMDGRYPSQTALGSAESETTLEGAESGRVIERVNWELTFTRKR